MKKLVLSVSGGGALGIGPLQFMIRIEKELGIKLSKVCEGYAGTSTGSIIASGFWIGMTAKQLFDLYNKNLSNIFKPREIELTDSFLNKIKINGYSISDLALLFQENYYRYDSSDLKKLLEKHFPYKMGRYDKPLFIPTTFMNGKSVEKVWDNNDEDTPQSFAVLTSCSAPTYFDTVTDKGNEYCDGGMWANDPIMVLESGIKRFCTDEKIKKQAEYKERFADGFKILSFNTGMVHPNSAPKEKHVIAWLRYIVDEWVARTGNSNYFEACANIGKENIFRCAPKVSKAYDMDDLDVINDVVKKWDEYFDSCEKKGDKKTVGQKVCEFIESTMEKK